MHILSRMLSVSLAYGNAFKKEQKSSIPVAMEYQLSLWMLLMLWFFKQINLKHWLQSLPATYYLPILQLTLRGWYFDRAGMIMKTPQQTFILWQLIMNTEFTWFICQKCQMSLAQVSQQLTALLRIWTLSSQSTLGLYYNVTDLEERWDSTWPGHGGAGGEQGDCLLRAQRLVPGQVMLLKQRSEELQTSGGQFYAGAWRGGNGADHLIPDQAQVATVVKPCHSFKTISLIHFLSIVHVVLR